MWCLKGFIFSLFIPAFNAYVRSVPTMCCPAPAVERPGEFQQPKVLIAVVAAADATKKQELMMQSMTELANERVAWAVGLYKGVPADFDHVAKHAASLGVNFTAIDARPAPNIQCPFCPKLHLQLAFAKYTSEFDYIGLIDDDISFSNFSWRNFWLQHYNAGAPIIAQPLIRQDTQYEPYLAMRTQWKDCSNSTHVLTDIVEEQVPFMDARFFEWLGPKLTELISWQNRLMTASGPDLVWCGAASIYAQQVLQQPDRTPCALLFEPVDHFNFHSITKSQRYKKAGIKLKQMIYSGDIKSLVNFVPRRAQFISLDVRRNVWMARDCMRQFSRHRSRRPAPVRKPN